MESQFDISVIIPVYNAQDYLQECIDSILHQTKDRIEIVIVNDGSTDRSGDIIARNAQLHSSITVIEQSNQGVGAARSRGFLSAKGEYIGWIDADDMAKPDMFEELYRIAKTEDADYVYCNYEFFPHELSTKSKWFKEYHGVRDGNTQCWNTLVKKSLYEQVRIDQLLLEFGEYSWIAAMLAARKVACTRDELYIYRVGHSSLSGGGFTGRVPYYIKCVDLSRDLKKIIRGTAYEQKLESYFDYRYIYSLLLLLLVAAKNSDKKEYENARSELRRMNYLQNPYLDSFVASNYGKLKAWVVTRVMPLSYRIAVPIAKTAM